MDPAQQRYMKKRINAIGKQKGEARSGLSANLSPEVTHPEGNLGLVPTMTFPHL